jgi:LPXTG-motif cell wall-anchored protein
MIKVCRRRLAAACGAIILGSVFVITGAMTASAQPVTTTPTTTPAPAPTLAAQISPGTIPAGGTSRFTVTIGNAASSSAVTELAFTATLPSSVTVAQQPAASTTCTGGTVTAVAGSSGIALDDGSVAKSASCAVSVNVTAAAAGTFVIRTGALSSSAGAAAGASAGPTGASATLVVQARPVVPEQVAPQQVAPQQVVSRQVVPAQVQAAAAPTWSLSFDPALAVTGGTSTLAVTITPSEATTGLAFTIDDLKGLRVAATPNITTDGCGSPTWEPAADDTALTFSAGSTNASTPCIVGVNVTGPNGTYPITTSVLTFTTPGTGSPVAPVTGTLSIGVGTTTTRPITTVPTIPSTTPQPGLANTGTSRATVLTTIGLTLLGLGAILLIASRRVSRS